MCWRIVRIQGDGSVKLILADREAPCGPNTQSKTNSSLIGMSYNYNIPEVFVTGGQFNTNYNNIIVNFNGLDINYLKNENWCFGNIEDAYDINKNYLGKVSELNICESFGYYVNYFRIFSDKNYTMNCSKTGINGAYKTEQAYAGGLTADEIIFAGGILTGDKNEFYLKENANIGFDNIDNYGYSSYTYTGFGDCDDDEGHYIVLYNGGTNAYFGSSHAYNDLRPSVVLNSKVNVVSGNGTIGKPYIISVS